MTPAWGTHLCMHHFNLPLTYTLQCQNHQLQPEIVDP